MDKLSTNYALNYAFLHTPTQIGNAGTVDALKAQPEQAAMEDSFVRGYTRPYIGYESFSAYHVPSLLSDRLEGLQAVDIPAEGVPSAMLLKSMLEAIDEAAVDGEAEQLPGNPYILMDLLDMLVDKGLDK